MSTMTSQMLTFQKIKIHSLQIKSYMVKNSFLVEVTFKVKLDQWLWKDVELMKIDIGKALSFKKHIHNSCQTANYKIHAIRMYVTENI